MDKFRLSVRHSCITLLIAYACSVFDKLIEEVFGEQWRENILCNFSLWKSVNVQLWWKLLLAYCIGLTVLGADVSNHLVAVLFCLTGTR